LCLASNWNYEEQENGSVIFKTMDILLTGGSGLIGKSLIPHLIDIGHNVIRLTDPKGNPIDFSTEWNINTKSIPNCIIHLAQHPKFREFPEKAIDVFNTNTVSTLKLLDWAIKHKVKQFIYASSGGIYGYGDQPKHEEEKIVYHKSLGFYLATKHCSEVILDNYEQFLTIIQLRIFFAYGKNQNENMLIPRLINLIKQNKSITLDGNEGIKINPIYVQDAVHAITASLNLQKSTKINIAGNEVLSINEISQIIGNSLNKTPAFIRTNKVPQSIIGDIHKMKSLLLTPQYNFQMGIKEML
jgi:UDP-glucose 4-epimerase